MVIYKAVVSLLFDTHIRSLITALGIAIIQNFITGLQQHLIIIFILNFVWIQRHILVYMPGFKNPFLTGYIVAVLAQLGENSNYITGEKWVFEPRHIDQYMALDPDEIKYKNNYKVLLQTGDEVLDYRDAQSRYQGSDMSIEQQGDHSFINYHQHLASIVQFLMATPTITKLTP